MDFYTEPRSQYRTNLPQLTSKSQKQLFKKPIGLLRPTPKKANR